MIVRDDQGVDTNVSFLRNSPGVGFVVSENKF